MELAFAPARRTDPAATALGRAAVGGRCGNQLLLPLIGRLRRGRELVDKGAETRRDEIHDKPTQGSTGPRAPRPPLVKTAARVRPAKLGVRERRENVVASDICAMVSRAPDLVNPRRAGFSGIPPTRVKTLRGNELRASRQVPGGSWRMAGRPSV